MSYREKLFKTVLDTEQLAAIERMAAAAFTAKEIEEILEIVHLSVIIEDNNTIAHKAFRKGYLTRQLELRERIFQDAKNGSSPAQTIANKLLEDSLIKARL